MGIAGSTPERLTLRGAAEILLLAVAALTALQTFTLLPYRVNQNEAGLAAQEVKAEATDNTLQDVRENQRQILTDLRWIIQALGGEEP